MEYSLYKIGSRIADLRKEKGMSQEKFIEKLNHDYGFAIGRNKLSKIENGGDIVLGVDISFEFLRCVASIFDCDIGYLIGEYQEKKLEVHQICEYTGLSEEVVAELHKKTEFKKEYPNYDSFLEYLNAFTIYGLPTIYEEFDNYIDSVRSCGYLEKKYTQSVLREHITLCVDTTNNQIKKPGYSDEELEARNIYQNELSNTQPNNLFFLQKSFANFVEQYGKKIKDTITVKDYEEYISIKNNSVDKLCSNIEDAKNNFVNFIHNNETIKYIVKAKEIVDKINAKDGANNGNDK